MNTALFVSPHLDDVAFSCGGTLAAMAERGWRTILATCFTATVLPATGFALACQLDKGLDPAVDYMALRRAEDRAAADILRATDVLWLDLPEAPHRGYESAPALFSAVHDDDDVWQAVAARLGALIEQTQPVQIFAPQGLGGHVDHRQVIRAVQAVAGPIPVAWYRDTPYVIRDPKAAPFVTEADAPTMPIGPFLDLKIRAACAYTSQIGFQFGDADGVATALTALAAREGGERFSGSFYRSDHSHSQDTLSGSKGRVDSLPDLDRK